MGGILAFDKGGVDSFEMKLIDAVTVNLILSCLRQSSPNDKDQTLYVSRQQESIVINATCFPHPISRYCVLYIKRLRVPMYEGDDIFQDKNHI